MPNRQNILDTIEDLKRQLAQCDCHDESRFFVPKEDEDYFYIASVGGNDTDVDMSANYDGDKFTAFHSREVAEQHSEAFQTLLALRAAKGVVPMKHGVWQFLIEAREDGNRIEVRKRRDGGVKQSRCFSPAFENEQDASAAIESIGKDKIIHAMKVLAWG